MIVTIGTYSLCAAVLVAVAVLLVSLAAVRFAAEGLRRAARRGILILAGLLTLSSVALMTAMVRSDFSLSYVVRYTERALPMGYKIAAFWAGQEGSILLWAWLLSMMSVVFVLWPRERQSDQHTIATGVLALVIGFFVILMVSLDAANPFLLTATIPADGQGLNPMLQDPGMISHPPILFIGYAGFTIPFALLIGALLARRADNAWIIQARPWVLVSWLFLGAGILLGAQWAYTELGWGGYWAWDPVENASLLPWLTGTALLHSLIAQRQSGMLKRWTAVLAAITFILCIFGTFITRSGIIDSVHSFGKSLVGTFFLVFLLMVILASSGIILARWRLLRSEQPLEGLVTREGAFLAANILFLAMMLVTALGTMFPVISRTMTGQPLSVNQSFYNKVVLPMGLGVVAIMALAPLLGSGKAAAEKLVRSLGLSLILAMVAIVTVWRMNLRNPWALAIAGVCAVGLGAVVAELCRSVWVRQSQTRESIILATLRLLDGNHRRYGAQVVHIGVLMIVAGVAGSSLYDTKQTVQLKPGQTAIMAGYTITLQALRQSDGVNYKAVEAAITVTDSSGRTDTLNPERRLYNKADQANSIVALRSNWKQDLYVTLAGWDDNTLVTTLQVIVNPLVLWMWAGGIVVAIGGIYCLLPRLLGSRQTVQLPVGAVCHAKAANVLEQANCM